MIKDIICWWSGGVTSAIACWLAILLYGKDRCRIIFIDTHNEDDDTYRFKDDCEKWYNLPIESISAIPEKYSSIKDVWKKFKSLNVAYGAICSTELKRSVREKWEKENEWTHQVFGFDMKEPKRAISLVKNHSHTKPIFTLLLYGYFKKDCFAILQENNIEVPRAYKLGLHNNNCLKTGCVQGGIGYWQHMKDIIPDNFDNMADMEHLLTDLKGQPVTMLKDQSKGGALVFLKPHKDYPKIKDISMMKGRKPKPLLECNGLCGLNDLEERIETENELNYEQTKIF